MNNIYGSATIDPNTPTIIAGLTVPLRGGYSLKGIICWSEADCIIEIKLNVDTIGGGRISGAVQTLFLDFAASPYGLGERDVVSVIATQNDSLTPPGSYPVFCTILVEQL